MCCATVRIILCRVVLYFGREDEISLFFVWPFYAALSFEAA